MSAVHAVPPPSSTHPRSNPPALDDDETVRTPVEGLLAAELRAIRIALDPLPDSPRRRELRGRLETYARVVDDRRRLDVTKAQRWALLELVGKLRDDADVLVGRGSP